MKVDAVVVLCGGVGKRLWPLTATRPKCLLPLPGGETLVSRIVRQVKGFAEKVVVVAPPGLGGVFKEVLGSGVYVVEQLGYDSGGYGSGAGVRDGLRFLGDVDWVLVVNGDLVLHDEVFRILFESWDGSSPIVVGAWVDSDGRRFGVLDVEGGVVRRIVEKPGVPGRVLANVGVYLLPGRVLREAVEGLKSSPRGELEVTDAVNTVLSIRPAKLALIDESGFLDVGRWWDYLVACRRVLDWLVEGGCEAIDAEVSSSAVLKGRVCGRGFVVEHGSVVEGPVWLDEGVVIGPLAHLRPYTIVFRGSRIGAFVQVKASVLLEGVKANHLAYIGDSVVGAHVNIAAGDVIANLRLDEKPVKSCAGGVVHNTGFRKLGAAIGDYSRLGVNVSVMPGSRIGACCFIEPGAVVKHDVPNCSFYRKDGKIEDISSVVGECCKRIISSLKGEGLCVET